MENQSSIERRASRIKLLLMDCDGVLTDGRLWLMESGEEQKSFNVRDGMGLDLLRRAGLRSGVISGRVSEALERRSQELQIDFLRQGTSDKNRAFSEILLEARVDTGEVGFIGDDINDIPLMQQSELAVAVADAAEETRKVAHFVTRAKGGDGAVREVIEIILKAQGRWSEIMKHYLE
jgi:3-deoxy-D-manno-octulosonate 8-phosphate phosphatase (KDO 8-P phosphatase)